MRETNSLSYDIRYNILYIMHHIYNHILFLYIQWFVDHIYRVVYSNSTDSLYFAKCMPIVHILPIACFGRGISLRNTDQTSDTHVVQIILNISWVLDPIWLKATALSLVGAVPFPGIGKKVWSSCSALLVFSHMSLFRRKVAWGVAVGVHRSGAWGRPRGLGAWLWERTWEYQIL